MTTEARPTEPLRSEHRDFLPHLGALKSLRAEHIEVVARIDRLVSTVDMIPARSSRPNVAGDRGDQLLGLARMLRLHINEEEDVLLPVLDRFLAPQAATNLFARMAEVARS